MQHPKTIFFHICKKPNKNFFFVHINPLKSSSQSKKNFFSIEFMRPLPLKGQHTPHSRSSGLATEVLAVQNVSVSQGDRAMLGCIVNNLGAKTVSRLPNFVIKKCKKTTTTYCTILYYIVL